MITTADKKSILEEFSEWSGGFSPDECDLEDVDLYVREILDPKFDKEEVSEWFENLMDGNLEESVRIKVYNRHFTETKWSQDVKTKWHPGEGFFSKSAEAIAKGAKSGHKGDAGSAIKALQFHINRAGKGMSDEMKGRIKHAIKILQGKKTEALSKYEESRFNFEDEFSNLDELDNPSEEFYGNPADENEERELARRHVMRHAGVPFSPEFAENYKSVFNKTKESRFSFDDEFSEIPPGADLDTPQDEYFGDVADDNEERELVRRHVMRHGDFSPEFYENYKSKFQK